MTRDHTRARASIVLLPITIVLGAVGFSAVAAPATQEAETFSAIAQHVGTGPGVAAAGGGQTRVIIQITRWSTDEQRDELAAVLAERGSNELANALNRQPEVGFIRFPQNQTDFPSVRLRYARQFVDGDQRMIILAADRAIGFVEAMNRNPRTSDSRVSLIQLTMNGDRGEGVMAVGVEMEIDPETNTLSITNVSSQPARLRNVRKSN